MPEDDDSFTLENEEREPEPPPLFTPLPKAKQKPLLRGLKDLPGQQDLFPGMEVA